MMDIGQNYRITLQKKGLFYILSVEPKMKPGEIPQWGCGIFRLGLWKRELIFILKTVKIKQGEDSEYADSCDVCLKGEWHVAQLIYLL